MIATSLCVFGYAGGLQTVRRAVPSPARTSSIQCLDVVVVPSDEKKPEEGLRSVKAQDDTPEYMKSKRKMYPRKCDVMDQIEDFVQEKIDDGLLLNMEKAWQPSDFLPDPQKPTEEWVRGRTSHAGCGWLGCA